MSKTSVEIRKSRPLSPHLSIYKRQISSVLSVGHRLSGIGLFFALAIMVWWFILWVFSGFDSGYIGFFDYFFVKLILFVAVYGYFYHLCTGLRHLIWDMGFCFSIPSINITGWLAVAFSVLLTVCYWLLT